MKHDKRNLFPIFIFLIFLVSFQNCSGQVSAGDTFLFGLSEQFDKLFGKEAATAASCTSDITITTKTIYLEEDGDVTATFNASNDSGLNLSAGQWGYISFETCIYPNTPFSGSIDIPVSLTSNYGSRIYSVKSYPGAESALPTKLSFTGSGVSERQCFKFTASHDSLRNAVVNPLIVALGTMTQKDGNGKETSGTYSGKDVCDISVSLDDADAPGVRVSNISRVMEEPSPSASATDGNFQVKLRTAPTANVTIPINDIYDSVNANNREGSANPKTLTFTPTNFSTPQLVIVTSIDDLEIDGVKVYTVEVGKTTSSDLEYNGIKPRNVVVYNRDQSVPGYAYMRFDSSTGSTGTSGGTVTQFATDENNRFGSKYSNFQLKLRTKPTNNVTLAFSSNCGNKCNILTPTLTFTPTNWNDYQSFQVEGKSDSANSGNVDYTISFVASSLDSTYNTTVTEPTFAVRSCDNDGTHLLQPCNFSGSPLGTASGRLSAVEGATTKIWMISQTNPGSDATIALTSTDTTEGTVPATVTVNSSNYNFMENNGANQILLTHVDDNEVDNAINWDVTTSLSTGSISYNPIDIYAVTTDNEAYFYVSKSGSTKEGSSSGADTATIDVCLGAQNTEEIKISVACAIYAAGTAAYGECGTLSTDTLTFPPSSRVNDEDAGDANCKNSSKRQTVTILGDEDTFSDGPQEFVVNLTKNANIDGVYSSGAATLPNQTITNRDNEPLGKRIYVSVVNTPGEMTAQGVFAADQTCNNNRPSGVTGGSFKALIVSNSAGSPSEVNNRIPNGINWVLTAGYHYYRCNTSGYANCSDEYSSLFVADGSAGFDPTNLPREFSTVGDQYWTGMTNTLVPATQVSTPVCTGDGLTYLHNCHGFTYQNCPSNPTSYLYGQSWTMTSANSITSQEAVCTGSKKLICVEQ
ncbi:hypothetical protein ND861_14625 [Leptospira sp. 2 VSF19]|uniref:DUF1554 domain-containing protein n=1 Tax=Leptospira soteropolitanensis TaxID=2950025 RepID=A0AAW5VF20_9LEPT|nr:hypothetical protein [Leptospira soteropolitanensis]MCW7493917.1 hypothetical protein [Leptospira soteropolitanensis]MCW7501511.1 hypothetical protein [Leptospira soteropolitanensis]MCW7523727.1 hypothetical protein [Leptospira soteropolitanensis]MCW7527590.1 hypothetical protein [Leptospira soteropolitanensis]MCW7531444.1 hypothetical protein [Leptospira soteropolitanensis]